MKNIKEKIMKAKFGKIVKKFAISALIFCIAGGALSGFLLRTQVFEMIKAKQTEEKYHQQYEHFYGEQKEQHKHGHDAVTTSDSKTTTSTTNSSKSTTKTSTSSSSTTSTTTVKAYNWKDQIKTPSVGTMIVLGFLCLIAIGFIVTYWLIVMAWLYKASVLVGMNKSLWPILGIFFNIFALFAFLIVRDRPVKKIIQ